MTVVEHGSNRLARPYMNVKAELSLIRILRLIEQTIRAQLFSLVSNMCLLHWAMLPWSTWRFHRAKLLEPEIIDLKMREAFVDLVHFLP